MRATVTGMPLLSSEGTRRSLSAIRRAELIALPLLFIALLLVFQSFAAAAIPAAFGAATIASSTGLLALLAGAVKLDAFALAISSMVGLALAVDYSLLLVSRVREELGDQHDGDVRRAVHRAAAPTIRTVAVAAAAIVVAMAVAAAASPGTGLLAAAIGVSVVAAVSAATAMLVVPSILVLAGPYLGGVAPAGIAAGGISASIARASMRRPLLGLAAAVLLLVACIPVLSLQTGAPTAQSLPSDSARSSAAPSARCRREATRSPRRSPSSTAAPARSAAPSVRCARTSTASPAASATASSAAAGWRAASTTHRAP